MVTSNKKAFYKSSTLWINFVGIAVIVLELVVKSDLIPDADIIAIVVAVLNILNRTRAKAYPLSIK